MWLPGHTANYTVAFKDALEIAELSGRRSELIPRFFLLLYSQTSESNNKYSTWFNPVVQTVDYLAI